MKIEQGYFSVIRWRPDVTRDECRNLGVILVDQYGANGGVRWLTKSGLPSQVRGQGIVEQWLNTIHERAIGDQRMTITELEHLSQTLDRSLLLTFPKRTAILEGKWEQALEQLWKSYASPLPQARERQPTAALRKQLRALIIAGSVYENYEMPLSRSGVPRVVNFFANSGANVVIEGITLNLQRPDAIIQRADAEANKIKDISASDIKWVIYVDEGIDAKTAEFREHARKILEETDAKIITDVREVLDLVH